MDRTIWNDGVEVTQTQLAGEHTALVSNILQRWKDGATMGVITGLAVSVNGTNNVLVDLAAGRGYCPTGDLVELLTPVTGITLSNYGAGIDNYVCLIYTETSSKPEAHETDGSTRNTKAARAVRVKVFTLTELNALVSTFADLSVDARDRVLVCGIVNANGLAIAITPSDITLPPTQPRYLTIQQPSTLTGVTIKDIDPLTPTTADRIAAGDIGNSLASLQIDTNATPPGTLNIKYKAPGDTTYGASVPIGGGGSPFTLVSSGGRTLVIGVAIPLLTPLPLLTIAETLTVAELYANPVQIGGARDEPHRRDRGSAMPTAVNPHGALVKDLANQHEVPWGLFLGTGLSSTLAQALTPRLLTPQAPISFADRTYLWEIALDNQTGRKIRLWVNKFRTFEVTVNAWFNGLTWQKDDVAQTASKFSMFDSGIAHFSTRTGVNLWGDGSWDTNPMFLAGVAGVAGIMNMNTRMNLGQLLLGSLAGRDEPRIYNEYDNPGGGGILRTLVFEQRRSGGVVDERLIRIYRANSVLSIPRNDVLEMTFNARWDTAGNQWVKDAGGISAAKVEFHKDFILFLQRLAGSASPFTDVQGGAGWDAPGFTFNLTLGIMVAQGGYYTNGDYNFGSPRTFRQALNGTDCAFQGATMKHDIQSFGFSFNHALTKSGAGLAAALWPLRLPQGATLTGITMYGAVSLFGGDARATAIRIVDNFAANQTLYSGGGGYTVFGSFGPGPQVVNVDQNNVIDNANFSYGLYFLIQNAAECTINKVYVTYTLPNIVLP